MTGNALVKGLNLPYWKGYSKPTQTKLKNKPPKDQTDLQMNWRLEQNSTVFKEERRIQTLNNQTLKISTRYLKSRKTQAITKGKNQ